MRVSSTGFIHGIQIRSAWRSGTHQSLVLDLDKDAVKLRSHPDRKGPIAQLERLETLKAVGIGHVYHTGDIGGDDQVLEWMHGDQSVIVGERVDTLAEGRVPYDHAPSGGDQ